MSHYKTTTCTPDRNPDIQIGRDDIPEGCYVHEGKLLQQRAKSAKIPFGVASRWVASGKSHRWETAGLVIRKLDRARMTEAAIRKARTTGKGAA